MTDPSRYDVLHLADREIASVTIGGLPLALIDRHNSAQLMAEAALARRGSDSPPLVITSANGQVISMCARDPEIRSLFLAADLIHADGTPLVFASRLPGRRRLPERVATTDLFHDVAAVAEERGVTFYLLGAAPDVMAASIDKVSRRYHRLQIAGFRHGYFKPEQADEIVAEINAAAPDILWIGMGVPLEQSFALRHRGKLTNVGLIKTSGGLFDFLSERVSRAPLWMQSAGLEWLYRLALEPRRLFLRYFLTNPHALYLLLAGSPQAVHGAETIRLGNRR
jgi:N-acetylglucosaminyldiphosphoundecaprenol N-acetyl-beta-D-mannosaminyltransferase